MYSPFGFRYVNYTYQREFWGLFCSHYTAMAAIWESATAIQAVQSNPTAWATFTGASSSVMGKTVAILAGLNPDSYADMTAIAASSTAMTAVAASSTAMTAVIASSTALNAVVTSSTAMAAVIASPTALNAVVTSSTAMTAVAASSTAMTAVAASSVALAALNASALKQTYTATSAGTNVYVTVRTGRLLVLSLLGTGSNSWTARNFTVPDSSDVSFTTTLISLCKTADNLQVAYGSTSTSQTATITGIPV